MHRSNTLFILVSFFLWVTASAMTAAAQSDAAKVADKGLDPQDHPLATSEQAYPSPLSGTVVDPSGAVIAGATVLVRSANGTVQRTTQTDRNGSFIISGLSAGNYQL